jgi:hypothetical protein
MNQIRLIQSFVTNVVWVLTYDAYNETLNQQEKQKSDLNRLEDGLRKLDQVFQKFVT